MRISRWMPRLAGRIALRRLLPPAGMVRCVERFSSVVEHPYDAAKRVLDAQNGRPPRKDDLQAVLPLLEAAATSGHVEAIGRLGRWYLLGIGGIEPDANTAVALLHAAAVEGDVEGQFWLAALLMDPSRFVKAHEDAHILPSPRPIDSIRDEASAKQEFARGRQVIKEIRRLQLANRKKQSIPSTGSTQAGVPAEARMTDAASPPPVAADRELARLWLHRAADKGHTPAMVALGNACMREKPPDVSGAVRWYLAAGGAPTGSTVAGSLPPADAAASSASAASEAAGMLPASSKPRADALFNLGLLWYDGVKAPVSTTIPTGDDASLQTPPTDATAIRASTAATDVTGKTEWLLEPNPADALVCLRLSAELGDASAQFWMGQALLHGDERVGMTRDVEQAVKVLAAAGKAGHGRARLYMARLCDGVEGADVAEVAVAASPQRQGAGRAWLESAAEAGEGEALFELGQLCLRDPAQRRGALSCFLDAGKAGYSEGFVAAGVLFYRGGPWGEPSHAMAWNAYQSAAQLGNPRAWRNLADMLAKGEGAPQSEETARAILEMVDKHMTSRDDETTLEPTERA